jgi:hypothetical protein
VNAGVKGEEDFVTWLMFQNDRFAGSSCAFVSAFNEAEGCAAI